MYPDEAPACPECGILNPLVIGGQCQSCEANRLDAERQAAQKPTTVCLACRHDGDWSDAYPFCSSCCDAGWDQAYGRGVRDAVLAIFADLRDKKDSEHVIAAIKGLLAENQLAELAAELA